MMPSSRLTAIVALAKQAGQAILREYDRAGTDFISKPGGSPLTRADLASHHLILAGLQALTPALPVLSEESAALPYEQRRQWRAYWLVDPLDGTKEFLKRNGEFTVNIALVEEGAPVLGVIYAPALDLTYFALRSEGAFRQGPDEKPVAIAVQNHRDAKLKVVASRSHSTDGLNGDLHRLGEHEYVKMGSSLKFCAVADGTAHLYLRRGPTMEWDTAAGQCIVEAAGGMVTDLQGKTLSYNKPNLLNPAFLATSIPDVWQDLLKEETLHIT